MDLGSVAAWAGALFTGAGFCGAIVQLRLNLKDSRAAREELRREEREKRVAMARAVGVKASWRPDDRGRPPRGSGGLMPVEVEVINAGPYPIDTAVLELASDDEEMPMEIVYGTIFPGEHVKETHLVRRTEVVFGELTAGATLVFTDAFGAHWARTTFDLESREQPARIC